MSRPSLNPIQHWALQYWFYLHRRKYIEDADKELEAFCSVMWPERWKQLYGEDKPPVFDGEEQIPITDPADLDEWFNNLANQRGMSGAEAAEVLGASVFGPDTPEGVGVRV